MFIYGIGIEGVCLFPMTIASLISADSHVVEPPDLWLERIDTKFKTPSPEAR